MKSSFTSHVWSPDPGLSTEGSSSGADLLNAKPLSHLDLVAKIWRKKSGIFMDFHGFSWIFMDFHGFSWISWGPNCWRNWFWWIVQISMISWYHPAGRFPGDGPSAEIPLGGWSVLLETNLQLITVWRGFNEIKSEILLDITQSSFKLGSNSIQRPQPPSPFTEVKMSRSVFVSISDGEAHMSDMSDGCQWLMVKRGFFMRFMKLCGPPIPKTLPNTFFSPLWAKRFRNSNCYCLVSGPWTSIFAECAHLRNQNEKKIK